MGESPQQDDAGGVLASRDCLTRTIVEQIAEQGFYQVSLDQQPLQAIIDLRWAAQVAGRVMGRQIRTYASTSGTKPARTVTVIVAPTDVRCAADVRTREYVRGLIERLIAGETGAVRPRARIA